MKRSFVYFIALISLLLNACSKEIKIEDPRFAHVYVTSRAFLASPNIEAFVDGKSIGKVEANGYAESVVKGDKPLKLTFNLLSSGEEVLDTTFTPKEDNRFVVMIDTALGIRQFYVPPASQVDDQHIRVQFFHKIVYNGVEYPKVNFKLYTRSLPSGGPLTETPYEIDNVEFGKLSAPIDLPIFPSEAYYFVKTFDAETGQVLLDLYEEYFDGCLIELDATHGGRSCVTDVKTADFPPYGAFYDYIKTYYF